MKKCLLFSAALIVLMTVLSGCQKQRLAATPQSVYVWTKPVIQTAAEGTRCITIFATGDWTASSDADWVVPYPTSGERGSKEIFLEYSANTSESQRTAAITFTCGSYSESYILTQKPKN